MINKPVKAAFLKSMTAYGRAAQSTPIGRFLVEIHTLNRRHLEMHLSIPRQMTRFEVEMRKWIEAKVGRGQVNVNLIWHPENVQAVKVVPNFPLAKSVNEAWISIAQELNISTEVTLELLSQQRDMLIFEEALQDESLYLSSLQSVMQMALDQVVEMREKEGRLLAEDLLKRFAFMEMTIEKIAGNAHKAPEKYREKLKQRLEELFTGHPENEEKVLREIALFAEKIDITEEIVRFRAHLHHVQLLFAKPFEKSASAETKGKTLEFYVQELHREINTIGSKASDLEIAQWVVLIKSELERVREQIQNVE